MKVICETMSKKLNKPLSRNNNEWLDFDGMCWECWDDQLTEESDTMFGDLM